MENDIVIGGCASFENTLAGIHSRFPNAVGYEYQSNYRNLEMVSIARI